MSGFTKLVPEIVQSSIWNESAEVRCVWIAMIATKDKDGNIRGNRLALARLANVPVESVDVALRKFQAPDPDSNNQDNEGRRIEAIPGGWHIISHSVYRAKDYREHEAERKKLYREKKQMSGTCPGQVPDSSVSVSASSSVSVEGGCKGETKPTTFDIFWKAYPKKVAKKAALKAWEKAKDKPSTDVIIAAVKKQEQSLHWKKDGGQFIPYPATWLNEGRWDDETIITKIQTESAI